MAYGIKYQINFVRFSDDLPGLINILLKDYAGPVITVEGANSPIKISYKSGDYYANDPIRSSEADINFYNNGSIDLSDFDGYDNNCRVDYYLNSVLTWSGFLSLDDCSEDMQVSPNIISLRATDGLGLLKDIPFTDESGALIYSQQSILTVFKYCLYYTYLQLPTNIYVNIFESGMQDKSIAATKEPFSQVFLDCKMFLITQDSQKELNDSLNPVLLIDQVKNCYDILSVILEDWGCTLYQANGCWNITRWFELKDNNNVIPGVQYDATFTTPSVAPNINLTAISNSNPVKFIGAGQRKYLVRGNNYVNAEFDYKQISQLILNADLIILGALQRSYTVNNWGYGPYFNGITYLIKEYAFPDWVINGYTGFTGNQPCIRVIYDTRNNIEIERYVVMQQYTTTYTDPYGTTVYPNILFNEVLVSKGDRMDFSFNWRASHSVSGTIVNIRVSLMTAAGKFYNLIFHTPSTGGNYFSWSAIDTYENGDIIQNGLDNDGANSNSFSLSSMISVAGGNSNSVFPAFPDTGYLRIAMVGFNRHGSVSADFFLSGINLSITNYINNSLIKIIGDYHQSNQNKSIRKYLNKSLTVSDSPSVTIQGAMMLNDNLTLTKSWYRVANKTNTNLFHYWQTLEWMWLTDSTRTKIDASFQGDTDSNGLIGLGNVFTVDELPGKYFILGQCEFDCQDQSWNGTLEEVWNTSDAFLESMFTNIFNYLYQQS